MYTVPAGQALTIELAALDVSTGLPYVPAGDVYVVLRDVTAGQWWGGAWVSSEPTITTLLAATPLGNGGFSVEIPVEATTSRQSHVLRAQLVTTYDEGAEVLVSQVETISVTEATTAPAGAVAGVPTTRKGITAAALRARVLSDVQDTAGTRWGGLVYSWFDDALRHLAERGCFVRTDVLTVTANRGVYAPHCDVGEYIEVRFNGLPLSARSPGQLARLAGLDWHKRTGTPIHYVPGDMLTLYPIPQTTSTAPTLTGSPPIAESQGLGVLGSGYTCTEIAGTLYHYIPGDGTVTGGAALLEVEYSYFPAEVEPGTVLPRDLADALRYFALWRALETSDDTEEARQAERHGVSWFAASDRLASRRRSSRRAANYLPMSFAENYPAARRYDILTDS